MQVYRPIPIPPPASAEEKAWREQMARDIEALDLDDLTPAGNSPKRTTRGQGS